MTEPEDPAASHSPPADRPALERALDQALADTFPASDPVALSGPG